MDTHYVCRSCMGTSDQAKACETEGCAMKGQPMEECYCEDGQHGMKTEMA